MARVFNVFSNIDSTKFPLIEQWLISSFDIHWILLGTVGKQKKRHFTLEESSVAFQKW